MSQVLWDLRELQSLIDEYAARVEKVNAMSETWNDPDADPCDQAESDPGLQYAADMEAEEKLDEIKALARKVAEGDY